MNTFRDHHHQHQQQQKHHEPQHYPAGGNGNNNSEADNVRRTHLTKFAFLLSSARGEGSDEPVVGMHHDVEMAACFSRRHLQQRGNGVMTQHGPPSISSSSLSMASANGGGAAGGSSCKKNLLETAATNMCAPFYTTPDTVSSTAKTVLKNIVSNMEELVDSRLRSTVTQLVRRAGGIANSQLLFRLLSPSREPIKVATVITRFVLPDDGDAETNKGSSGSDQGGATLSIPLQFKAILDVRVFGEVSTVELSAPVAMSGRFDPQDGLLTAVDVGFDCAALLRNMISQARLVVKTAVTKAAALSVQIAKWHAEKKASSLQGAGGHGCGMAGASAPSALSLHSLLGSSISLGSLNSLDGGSLFSSSFSSFNHSHNNGNKPACGNRQPGKGLLRESSRGLLRRNANNNNNTMAMLKSRQDSFSSNNANATFDFGSGNQSNNPGGTLGHRTSSSTSVVRFRMPNSSKRVSCSDESESSLNNKAQQFHNAPQAGLVPVLKQEQQQDQQANPHQEQSQNKGNIHAGLFSWLQDDSMFLTEEKIREQEAADEEAERERREAPQPLRFFTAAQEMGGLEMVSRSIFGQGQEQQQGQQQVKREQTQGDGQHAKRRKVWHH